MIKRSGPNLDRVVIEKCGAIGVIVIVLEHDPHPIIRMIAIKLGNGIISGLGYLRRPRGRPFQTLMIEDAEMFRLDYLPIELRVILRNSRSDPTSPQQQP